MRKYKTKGVTFYRANHNDWRKVVYKIQYKFQEFEDDRRVQRSDLKHHIPILRKTTVKSLGATRGLLHRYRELF